MRTILSLAFLCFFPSHLQAQSLTQVISKEEARQLAELVEMPDLDRFVSDQARTILSEALEGKMKEWASETAGRNDPEISRQLKEKIKARLIQWLPTQLEKILQKELLQGEIGKVIYAELNKTLNAQADQWIGGLYDRLINKFDRKDSVLFDQLGRLIGESTVRGLQNGILFGLQGELPEEAVKFLRQGPDKFAEYVEKGRAYLPRAQFQKLRDRFMQIHIVNLPNQVYGGILAASAAMHLAKAFAGPKINFYELRRAKEVTQTLIWQLKNKEGVSLTLGDFTEMIKKLGDQFGSFHWRAFQQMAKWNPAKQFLARLDQIEAQFKKIEKLYDQVTGKVLAGFNEAIAQLEAELKKISQELLKPMLNPIQCFNGIFPPPPHGPKAHSVGWGGGGILAEGCPNVMPKIPGIFGKFGDKSPWDYAKKWYEKSVVNKKMAEGLAAAAVKITDALHITGPLAKILKIEKVPAKNISQDSDFDPVFLHNGEFYYTATDLSLPGEGLDFQFTRIYRSRSRFLGLLGFQWTHNLAQRLLPWNSPQGFGLTYVDFEGKKYFLKETEPGIFQPPADLAIELQTVPEGYHLKRDGLIYQFSAEGVLRAIRDQENHQLILNYNDAGQLAEAVDTVQRQMRFHYFPNGLLAKLEDHTGRTWNYEYNESHNLIASTTPVTAAFPKGKTTRYSYENHKMTLIMDPKGQIYLKNYYGVRGKDKGKILAQKYGDGRTLIEARYDGLTTWVIDRRDVLHRYQHDEAGHLENRLPFAPPKAGLARADSQQFPHYEYDPWGNIVAIQYPDGSERRFEVDANNLITKEITNGEERYYKYDANDNIISIDVPSRQLKLEFEYDLLDRLLTKKEILYDHKIITTRHEYDPQGRLIRTVYPLGNDIRFIYDEAGLLTKRSSPTLLHEFFYDSQSRLTTAIDHNDLKDQSDDIEVHFAYDKASRLVGEKIHGQWVRKSFDPSGQKIGITYPNGMQVIREYQDGHLVRLFAEGQPIPIQDSTIEETQAAMEEPALQNTRRDANGNLLEDDNFTYTYDSLHRLVTLQDKQTKRVVRFQYDPLGRLARKDNTDYFYDGRNLIAAYPKEGNRRHYFYASEVGQPVAFLDLNRM